MKHKSATIGFLIAPIIISALFALIAAGTGFIQNLGHGFEPYTYLNGGLVWFIFALPVAYIATIIFGIPGYFLFKKKGINSVKSYILGGALLGAISPVLLLLIGNLKSITNMGLELFFISSFFGALTSYLFWKLSIQSPNKAVELDAIKDSRHSL